MESNAELGRAEYIDRYLRGELAEADRVDFERKLQEDAALYEEVESVRSVRSLLKNYGMRQDLQAIHARKMAEKGRSSSFQWLGSMPMRIAAGVVLLLASVLVIRMATLNPDSLGTQADTYQPEVVRGEANTPRSPSHMLLLEYANGNYKSVVSLYNQLRNPAIEDIFIASNAYLALARPDEAIKGFKRVLSQSNETSDRQFYPDAQYYLAWAYLKDNQVGQAESIFSQIHNTPSHPYHKKVGTWFYWQVKLLRWKQGA